MRVSIILLTAKLRGTRSPAWLIVTDKKTMPAMETASFLFIIDMTQIIIVTRMAMIEKSTTSGNFSSGKVTK